MRIKKIGSIGLLISFLFANFFAATYLSSSQLIGNQAKNEHPLNRNDIPLITILNVVPNPSNGLTTITVTNASSGINANGIMANVSTPSGGWLYPIMSYVGANIWIGFFTVTSDGIYDVRINATDLAGHTGYDGPVTIIGDVKPPVITLVSVLPNPSNGITTITAINASSDIIISGIMANVSTPSGEWIYPAMNYIGGNAWQGIFNVTMNGNYTIRINATDHAGNIAWDGPINITGALATVTNDWNWSSIKVLSTESSADSLSPSIVADASGNVHVVWQDSTNYSGAGTDYDIFYKYWNASSAFWSATEVISVESTAHSEVPAICVDPFGNVHVAWHDSTNYNGSGTDRDIFYKNWNNTTKNWSVTEIISTESTGVSGYPAISADPIGNIHVVWDDQTDYSSAGTDLDIFYKFYNLTTQNWVLTEVVSTESDSDSMRASLATDNESNIHVTWLDNSMDVVWGVDWDIFYKQRFSSNSTWTATEVISDESTSHSMNPTIGIDIFSNIHIAWNDWTNLDGAGSDVDILYKRWNFTAKSWSSTKLISTESTGASYYPVLVCDQNGNVDIVWEDESPILAAGSDRDVFYKRWYRTIDTWTYTEVISTNCNFHSTFPSISSDYFGSINIVWSDSTNYNGSGDDWDIFHRKKFTPPDPPLLFPISPHPTSPGRIDLNWSISFGATEYYIYRDTSFINSVDSLTPIAEVFVEYYQDVVTQNDTYYYVVVAFNNSGAGPPSNCESITITIPPPSPPLIASINPNPDTDGIINLTWSDEVGATIYFIYRSSAQILSISGLQPIATSIVSNFQDNITNNGQYFYVIVAGNVSSNSSISNCENVTVLVPLNIPILQLILPNPDHDGLIDLIWSNVSKATEYYIYRNTSVITSVVGLDPITMTNLTQYQDRLLVNLTFYYVLIATDSYVNSSLSNCQNITVEILPPDPPILAPISPNTSINGFISLDWNDVFDATTYYVYRNTSFISSIQDITPIGSTNDSDYLDFIYLNGTYYYVVVAGHDLKNSSISNCENVTIAILPSTEVFFDWGPIQEISTESSGGCSRPDIAADSFGNLHVVWYEGPSTYDIYYKFLNATTGIWSLTEHISTESSGSSFFPKIAVDSNNNVHIVWQDSANILGADLDEDIFYKFWNATSRNWSSTEVVSYYSLWHSYHPTLDIDNNGNVHVAWYDISGFDDYDIYYRIRNSTTGSWEMPLVVSTESTGDSYYPDLDVDFLGNVHIAWGDYTNLSSSGSDEDIFYKCWNVTSGSWTNTTVLSTESNADSVSVFLYVDDQSNIHVTWVDSTNYTGAGSDADIFYKFWNSSLSLWSVTEVVSGESTGDSCTPTIISNMGTLHCFWSDFTNYDGAGSDEDIFHKIRNSTGAWMNLEVVSENSTSYSQFQNSVLDIFGYIDLVWEDAQNIFFRQLRPVPNPPILSPIFPNPSSNGIINLTWTYRIGATSYHVFKDISPITDADGMIPIATVTTNNYQDIIQFNGTYYYVIIAMNASGNSPISNYESVIVAIPPPAPPVIEPIIPNPSSDGNITLNWNDVLHTIRYYIYRDLSPITSLTGLNPIAAVTSSNYTEVITLNQIYYYVVIAGNMMINSSLSNCVNVTVLIPLIPPVLQTISPNPDYDTIINLNWNIVLGAQSYYIYRNNSYITSVIGLTPIAEISGITFQDLPGDYDTFYYVIVASDFASNSSISNCVNVTLLLTAPSLQVIFPNPDHDGIINLIWNDIVNATTYYIYRENSLISNLSSLQPLASSSMSNYQDTLPSNGTYYYVIVAGNSLTNSSISNCENITFLLDPPTLQPITPNPDFDRIINLDWNNIENATIYYIYRAISPISSLAGLQPIGNSNTSDYQDTTPSDGIFHYVIVAGNLLTNSSLSNCENITVILPPPSPILDSLFPNPDSDGNINLNWSNAYAATIYYIYRDVIYISSTLGLQPIATLNITEYQDTFEINGTYYYAIVAGNIAGNSSSSNCENVTVAIPPPNPPMLNPILPNPNINGSILLTWDNVANATRYYVYRDTSPIFSTIGLTPLNMVANTNYTDLISLNGIYYYAVVAGRLSGNSSVSNCENITVLIPLSPPILEPILPNPVFNGNFYLNWSYILGATSYFIYQDTSPIFNITGLSPTAEVTNISFQVSIFYYGLLHYIIVASDFSANSSISNCENVTLLLAAPSLQALSPNPDHDGIINLNWNDIDNATIYYIYRDVSPIGSLAGLQPLATATVSNYQDTLSSNGTYYYVIMAGNLLTNSSISNCENVTFLLDPPTLQPILPNPDHNGIINLNWNDISDATIYYIYRDVSPIGSLVGLQPLATATVSNYQDILPSNGTYYYVIMAGNILTNSSISNCESVTFLLDPPTLQPILPNPVFSGIVDLNWNVVPGAITYYIYRNISPIITLNGIQPIGISAVNNFQDILPRKGIYYYVIVAGNSLINSSISNCESVLFDSLPSPTFRRVWDVTEVVSTESTSSSYYPSIAVDAAGNIHVTWYDYTNYGGSGSDYDIFYKYWDSTTRSWSITQVVSTVSTSYSRDPAIVTDLFGNVHIVWEDSTNYNGAGSDYDIFYRCWNATTGSWMVTEVISTEGTLNSYNPDVIIDLFGNLHVVWYDSTNYNGAGSDYDIFYKCWNATLGIWTPTEVISIESTSNSYMPDVAADLSGNIHIAWYDYTNYGGSGSDYDIFYKRWDVHSGIWTSTEVISTESTSTSQNPTIITDWFGNIHIAWYDSTNYNGAGSDYDIFYKCWNATLGIWTLTEVISTESSGSSNNPDFAIDDFGIIHLVWYDSMNYAGAGTDYDIFYKQLNTVTGLWTALEVISNVSTSNSYAPAITLDAVGNIHIIWYDYTNYNGAGTDYDIFYKKSKALFFPYAPQLNQISPNPDLDGIIDLDWPDVIGAISYYIYRDTSFIYSIDTLQPIATVSLSNFQDSLTLNNIYYYVVVSENGSGRSPISNCENITVLIPLNPPTLQPILPNPIYNGKVNLSWNIIVGATSYYIYLNYTFISSVSGLTPIAHVNNSSYQDNIVFYGTLYYVIVAADFATNSSISNCESVLLCIAPPNLHPIIPNPDFDGIICLVWDYISDADIYYIYRNTSNITSIDGLIPIESSVNLVYLDKISSYERYYYVIVAGNTIANSTPSNCESVIRGTIITYPDSSKGWDSLEVVSTQSTSTSYYPSIAVDAVGNIHVTWYDYTAYGGSGSDIDIFYRQWNTITQSWTGTEVVSTVSNEASYSPAIAVDLNGNVHVVWSDATDYMGSGADFDIFYRCRNASTGIWMNTEVVSTVSTSSSSQAVIVVDYYGTIHVAWRDSTIYMGAGSDSDIFYTCWNVSTRSWMITEVVSTISDGTSSSPTLAVDWNRNVHLAWFDNTNFSNASTDYDIFYRCRNFSANSWTFTELISTTSTNSSYDPAITADIFGNVHLVWSDQSNYRGTGLDLDIFYRCWNFSTMSWMGIEIISSESDDESSMPEILVDNFGIIHVIWVDSTNYKGAGIDSDIFYKFKDPLKNNWTNADVISVESESTSAAPAIAIDDAGLLYISWHDRTNINGAGIDYDIFYKRSTIAPKTPQLAPISPYYDEDGHIQLDWNTINTATLYYIYRDTSPIFSTYGLQPIAIVSTSSYTDTLNANGVYYYVIVAGNATGKSPVSNYESVSVSLPPLKMSDIVLISVLIGALAVSIFSFLLYKQHKYRSKTEPAPPSISRLGAIPSGKKITKNGTHAKFVPYNSFIPKPDRYCLQCGGLIRSGSRCKNCGK